MYQVRLCVFKTPSEHYTVIHQVSTIILYIRECCHSLIHSLLHYHLSLPPINPLSPIALYQTVTTDIVGFGWTMFMATQIAKGGKEEGGGGRTQKEEEDGKGK
jgi:hypothetical protein